MNKKDREYADYILATLRYIATRVGEAPPVGSIVTDDNMIPLAIANAIQLTTELRNR